MHIKLYICTVFGSMTNLVLNRKQNHANVLLVDHPERRETVGYLLPDGEMRFVTWLGFLDRRAARTLPDALPVRLANISRIGVQGGIHVAWEDLSDDKYVHGCLVAEGVYALYEQHVVVVGPRCDKPKNGPDLLQETVQK